MQSVLPLVCGIRGAEGGTAQIHRYGALGTRLTWYSDYEGLNPNASGADVQLDSLGRATVYVSSLARVLVKDTSGVTVADFVAGTKAEAVEYIGQSFTGTDPVDASSGPSKRTSLQSILDLWKTKNGAANDPASGIDWDVSVLGTDAPLKSWLEAMYMGLIVVTDPEYGAAGDGSTDDTAAIQSALTAAITLGGAVFFPPGSYRVTDTLDVPADVSLFGTSASKTAIFIDSASNIPALEFAISSIRRSVVTGLIIYSAQANSGDLILVKSGSKVEFHSCVFGASANDNGYLIRAATGASSLHIHNCQLVPGATASAVKVDGTLAEGVISSCLFSTLATYNPADGGTVMFGSGLIVRDCLFTAPGTAGTLSHVKATTATASGTVVGCRFQGSSGATVVCIDLGTYDTSTIFAEDANVFGSNGLAMTPYEFTLSLTLTPSDVRLGSRKHRTYQVLNDDATLLVDLRQYGTVIWNKSGTTAITNFGIDSAKLAARQVPPDGHETTFFIVASSTAINITGAANFPGATIASPAVASGTNGGYAAYTARTGRSPAVGPRHYVIAEMINNTVP